MAGLSVASTRRARRCGSPGRTAPAWSRRRARSSAAAWTSDPWLVPTTSRGLHGADPGGAVAHGVAGRGPAAHLRRRGLSSGDRRAGWPPPSREVWNTYGPTEATVVACAARLTGDGAGPDRAAARRLGPRRRRRPTGSGRRGRAGELIIGGVGLARYLDPVKDAEKYAADADPRLGPRVPQRRPGRDDGRAGVRWSCRRPGQARRPADRARGDRQRAARAARRGRRRRRRATDGRGQPAPGRLRRRRRGVRPRRRRSGCAADCRPRWSRGWPSSTTLPTRTSGKVDRDALPWPLPTRASGAGARPPPAPQLDRRIWATSWAPGRGRGDDFFDLGGGSLTAAQLVSRLRARFPEVTSPTSTSTRRSATSPASSAARPAPTAAPNRQGPPDAVEDPGGQVVSTLALRTAGRAAVAGLGRGSMNVLARWSGLDLAATVLVVVGAGSAGCCVLAARPDGARGRRAPGCCCAASARALPTRRQGAPAAVAGRAPGRRAAAPRTWPGRRGCLLRAGARRRGRRDVDLHSLPPVTGMLPLGAGVLDRARGRPDRALAGRRRAARRRVQVGAGARVGTRSTLGPGAAVGKDAEVAPGSAVLGAGARRGVLVGVARRAVGPARGPWSTDRPARPPRGCWRTPRPAVSRCLPLMAVLAGLSVALWPLRRATSSAMPAPGAALASGRRGASGWSRSRCWSLVMVGCSASGSRAATTRSTAGAAWQAWATCGCSTRPGPGCSRSTRAR